MSKIEILAPAGGQEQLIAAVRCGADAVYLGTGSFNARRNADNFSGDSLNEAVSYCHARGTAVHVTLNTLVYDDEMQMLEQEMEKIAASGADAVIIQDLAVLKMITSKYPAIKRHASTQMTVHNTDGVKLMADLGFDRVVLSRELSIREIEKICSSVDIETEVFIHGALCMSCSGGCYLSSMLGGRSGNRGLCAQPCRLDFKSGKREYALSLKDMSHIEYLRELSDIGVSSFKIEGRMKRPEYVAAAVTACRKAAAGEEYDLQSLQAVFSRSGFTDGYAVGKRDLNMFGYRRHEDVKASTAILGELAGLYRKERQAVSVDFSIEIAQDKQTQLTASDGKNTVVILGEIPQIALNRETNMETVRASIGKTGGTPFYLNNISGNIQPGLMLPASELNRLRREALEKLLSKRSETVPYEKQDCNAIQPCRHIAEPMKLRGRFEKASQITDIEIFDKIILPSSEIFRNPQILEKYGDKLICELPSLLFPETEDIFTQKLESAMRNGLKSVITDNYYGIYLSRQLGLELHGGHGLNVFNTSAVEYLEKLGVQDATMSFELQMKKIAEIGGSLPRGIIVYGRLPLMRFRSCPVQGENGCAGCDGRKSLKDRMGKEFPVRCQNRQYSNLLNSVPLFLDRGRIRNVDFATMYFTIESKEECRHAVQEFMSGEKTALPHTTGLYFREVM